MEEKRTGEERSKGKFKKKRKRGEEEGIKRRRVKTCIYEVVK